MSALLSLGQFQLARLLEQFVGGVVGLDVSHLSVTDLVLYHTQLTLLSTLVNGLKTWSLIASVCPLSSATQLSSQGSVMWNKPAMH